MIVDVMLIVAVVLCAVFSGVPLFDYCLEWWHLGKKNTSYRNSKEGSSH